MNGLQRQAYARLDSERRFRQSNGHTRKYVRYYCISVFVSSRRNDQAKNRKNRPGKTKVTRVNVIFSKSHNNPKNCFVCPLRREQAIFQGKPPGNGEVIAVSVITVFRHQFQVHRLCPVTVKSISVRTSRGLHQSNRKTVHSQLLSKNQRKQAETYRVIAFSKVEVIG